MTLHGRALFAALERQQGLRILNSAKTSIQPFIARRNQGIGHDDLEVVLVRTPDFENLSIGSPSDRLADVLLQFSDCVGVAADCPRSVRVSNER